ncbi:MAG: hypothetical protein KatS3mg076_3165 [Candidatus Binatia bacterium]|nr:MAG: hypothetical protein KatS3mg076_3165 [Candidatus Binatia bacterium]
MRPKKLLLVCHANTSRSVMAEFLLRELLAERGLAGALSIRSAGIAPYARDGALVSLDARLALREIGIEVPEETVATDLKRNRHLYEEADFVVTMTEEQLAMLREAFPGPPEKAAHTLKEWAGESGDIEDPAGQDEDVFRACRDEIRRCLLRALPRWLDGA